MVRHTAIVVLALLSVASSRTHASSAAALTAELQPATVAAFDRYVRAAEARIDAELSRQDRFLHLDALPDAQRKAAEAATRRGEVFIDKLQVREGGKEIGIPDGKVHHWVGVAFIPGVRVGNAVALLQDYDRHADIYKPAVQRSKVLSRDGDRFRVFLRFYQKKVLEVTVNSEHEAQFTSPSPDRAYSRIRSTRIAEVDEAGKPGEREKPVGRDGGYLWRLNTYWRFLERDGGTYIQCESVTLTRDVPFGFGWLIGPFVNSIPRESLTFTMERTRAALNPRS